MTKVALISTFPPTQCGIATYSRDLIHSITSLTADVHFRKLRLAHAGETATHNDLLIRNDVEADYHMAADFINSSDVDVVDLQHEFKIYGKPNGEHLLTLLNKIKKPIVTTLHTVSPNLNVQRERVFQELLAKSEILNVFSSEAKDFLMRTYKIATSKIEVIPHGVPAISKIKACNTTERNGSLPITFVSAGHFREAKGYELALHSLSLLRKEIPHFQYLILGEDHPQNESSTEYREHLLNQIKNLGLQKHVSFIDRYLEQHELINYLQLADIGLLPYINLGQSSSGILALMIACGLPLVTTPFQFANAHITQKSGFVSRSGEIHDFAIAIKQLVSNYRSWPEISEYNYQLGEKWQWNTVGQIYANQYLELALDNKTPRKGHQHYHFSSAKEL